MAVRRILKPCAMCGRDFIAGDNRTTLCPPCVKTLQVGPTHPRWKGGISKDRAHYHRLYRERHPEHYPAQRLMRLAIKSGELVRPSGCETCGVSCKPDGHHDDYGKPLDIRWLCRKCHVRRHHELGRGNVAGNRISHYEGA